MDAKFFWHITQKNSLGKNPKISHRKKWQNFIRKVRDVFTLQLFNRREATVTPKCFRNICSVECQLSKTVDTMSLSDCSVEIFNILSDMCRWIDFWKQFKLCTCISLSRLENGYRSWEDYCKSIAGKSPLSIETTSRLPLRQTNG